ncbi:hypothetical protein BXZ70DRAFT_906587 [Cristinia sonorae]|uniref:Uncharacterized protein n=1 Tax=Cristinia sonorae TaxID=1940300 RepID=A0A8K0XQI2_9AGAR|nr:hypothetical protein BXZ70DRAFT_906587 [Cristinia sonorae]
MFKSFIVAALVFAGVGVHAESICPGYMYGIADLGNQNYRIYDYSCKSVETDILVGQNVCTIDKFTCSPPPVTITGVKLDGRWYSCQRGGGSCNGEHINVCYCCGDCPRKWDVILHHVSFRAPIMLQSFSLH